MNTKKSKTSVLKNQIFIKEVNNLKLRTESEV